jgi:hypothetical protein
MITHSSLSQTIAAQDEALAIVRDPGAFYARPQLERNLLSTMMIDTIAAHQFIALRTERVGPEAADTDEICRSLALAGDALVNAARSLPSAGPNFPAGPVLPTQPPIPRHNLERAANLLGAIPVLASSKRNSEQVGYVHATAGRASAAYNSARVLLQGVDDALLPHLQPNALIAGLTPSGLWSFAAGDRFRVAARSMIDANRIASGPNPSVPYDWLDPSAR